MHAINKVFEIKYVSVLVFLLMTGVSFAQTDIRGEIKLDHAKINAYALDGNIRAALRLVDIDSAQLSVADKRYKKALESRFKFTGDESVYPKTPSPVDDLIKIYKDYWRKALLDTAANFDLQLRKNLVEFLVANYLPAKEIAGASNKEISGPEAAVFLKEYLNTFHLYTTSFGKTGKLYDLLIWRTQKDTVYHFSLQKETTNAPVTMMDDFITLGWEEYATLGRYYPGGWATKQSLFCVTKAYDLTSESFLISYLAHESRHFADYSLFPELKGTDLEYRAKLTELSMANTSLYKTIGFFIDNANPQSANAHSVADYHVIRDMSKSIFRTETVNNNIDDWKRISIRKINKTARKMLQENTKTLQQSGRKLSNNNS